MAKALYLIPFMFAFSSLLSESFTELFFDAAVLFFALALLPLALEGYWTKPLQLFERIVLALVSVGFVWSAIDSVSVSWPWAALLLLFAGTILVRSYRKPRL